MVYPDPANGSLQCTLTEATQFRGSDLQGSRTVTVKLLPAPVNSGICFIRTDVDSSRASIPATWKNVVDTYLGIVLGNEFGTTVAGVGHLLAALRSAGIDNLLIELDADEIPALDGSAAALVGLIAAAGVARQNRPRFGILIERPVEIREGASYALLTPSSMTRVTVSVDHFDADRGPQCLSLQWSSDTFARLVAPARSPGFTDPTSILRRACDLIDRSNDAYHGDEYLRHKILECCADLALAGAPIYGHLFAHKPGHRLNTALLQTLFANGEAWRCLEIQEINRHIRHEDRIV